MYVFYWTTSLSDCRLTRYDVGQAMSIDKLFDDVLLDIFDFYVIEQSNDKKEVEAWQTLVHVCRQWRTIVFGSSRRLNLRLYCATTTQTPLDVWPTLPLCIQGSVESTEESDNIIAVLKRSNPVYHIDLTDYSSYLENILVAMQKPFPELTFLSLFSYKGVTVVPDSFLGGSALPLRELKLDNIAFPGLPKLLLSAIHLTDLFLFNIPYSGYFSPEAIVTALSTLASLGELILEFQSLSPYRESQRPPPLTRSNLPVLRTLMFKGIVKYLEDFVALINAPQLSSLHITLFHQVLFDTPQSIQFISRVPKLKALKKACLAFKNDGAAVILVSPNGTSYDDVEVKILRREFDDSDRQVLSLEQVCNSCLPPLSALEGLYIYEDTLLPLDWRGNVENTLWLELLRPFSAVKNLYLSEEFAPHIAPALQELIGSGTIEVLPALQNILLEGLHSSGPVQEGIVKFVAARQLSGYPITVSNWKRYGI